MLAFPLKDPAQSALLNRERQKILEEGSAEMEGLSWDFEKRFMTPYAKLNKLLQFEIERRQDARLEKKYGKAFQEEIPTLWKQRHKNYALKKARLEKRTDLVSKERLQYTLDKRRWLEEESQKLSTVLMPLLRDFHWEDAAGGEQELKPLLQWYELTRINHKDLLSALIFGIRISFMVGFTAVFLQVLIGLPIGSLAGFYGGKVDMITTRLLEIWEAMPSFFMLLLWISVLQSKSIFLVIFVLGVFSWTGISRFIRAEVLRQRILPYVLACKSMGFRDSRIIFYHILPNAIPPVLTLLPFAIMGAISSEAGLSFIGLGEEGSCSWGVLMDEGRQAFPAESYLLWPPAIFLTTLLVAIALLGDAIRDALDPKMR